MKKIDFHIHTHRTAKDNNFKFNLAVLVEYTKSLDIDAIAITNHNIFLKDQYNDIANTLECVVFPGIEIDLENGHILIIAPIELLDEFESQCITIAGNVKTGIERFSVNKILEIFTNLDQYLVIPHYHKSPQVSDNELLQLKNHIVAGEVQSPKNWEVTKKDGNALTPVLFSDFREYDIESEKYIFPTRQTYINCDEMTISKIKLTLCEKKNVYLTYDKSENIFPLLNNGTMASTGLNVILGKRSSGKSYTLDSISSSYKEADIKYIKQFQIINKSATDYFREIINRQHAETIEGYLDQLKGIVDRLIKYDYLSERSQIDEYLRTLKEFAKGAEKEDTFSSTKIFSEDLLYEFDLSELKKLIESLLYILDNDLYKDEIVKYLDLTKYPLLIEKLVKTFRKYSLSNIITKDVNEIVANIKTDLGKKSSVVPITEFDFIEAFKNLVFIDHFNNLVKQGGAPRIISTNNIFEFKIQCRINLVKSATDLNNLCGTKGTQQFFSTTYSPFEYYEKLVENKEEIKLAMTEIFKAFWKIDYVVLNKYNKELSGGEKAEFNLLAEIQDSSKYEIILIDEPESSFDNIFIKDNVIQMIRDLALKSTVFIVTHNNTLGMLMKPDCIIYTEKSDTPDGDIYNVYTGTLTSNTLKTADGKEKETYEILMNTMEASYDAYTERKAIYESIKNK